MSSKTKPFQFIPFSQNIIFFDAEFSSLNPYEGEIISVSLVKPNGRELYLELEYAGDHDPWVKKNILPMLSGPKVSRQDAKKQIKRFVGKKRPYLLSYVDHFDAVFMLKLFGDKNKWPFYWMPLDFASMLFAQGIDPDSIGGNKTKFYEQLGIDHKKYQKHHALDDAKLLRELYLVLTGKDN